MDKEKPEIREKEAEAQLFGLDEKSSLQSVNFAPSENQLLNEHFQEKDSIE